MSGYARRAMGRAGVAERGVVALGAVAAIVLLAVWLTAAHAGQQLFYLQFHTPHPSAADLARARSLAAASGRLTPGERPAIELAKTRARAGDRAGASALLEGAVRREPQNAEAWLDLSRTAPDPALAARAAQRVRALAPPVPAP